ncbi:hypothetical protein YG5714_3068 [Sulfolobus islandicus Y.G.57.14]|jgi:hypothetical protein|uniref:Uncharacterized protein n=6 Tax=Saccharolobus islandicus TaxID=43080 RepID=M9U9Q0_SACIS|nr:hypothetical protein [Sulfolobus islandicus]ACP46881.1 hypothetical protein YG5714_3068 [Sulfolobus islandicus Y.G.57.14]ACP47440.1 conserved hypothetical protein [Sulfolobus islandicus Y.N.15.51]ADB88415.1 conserved hypothetical protein [Sulfolobus islandicus L.D.8.5]ADX83772.1 hypothetical protein SiH_2434 [Sulfolobus islandicus HVE10/4]ADX86496.1 hypothetical protein SiRe_2448 [Sulfolobus islandicus REY15A]
MNWENQRDYTKIRVLVYLGITEEEKKIFNIRFSDVRVKKYAIALNKSIEK